MLSSKSNQSRIHTYFISVLLVVLVTVFGEFLKISVRQTNLAMLYFLAVVISAIRWGKGPAILTAVLGALSFDFFLVKPYYAFAVADLEYVFTFVIFLIVGLIISALASKTKKQAIEVREKEIQAELLSQTEKLQTALLNSISHDLKTPLVSITGALSGLLQDPLLQSEEMRKELLITAYNESKQLNHLVENLLDMTRIESGTLKLHLETCYIKDIIRTSLQQLRDKLEKREVVVEIPKDFPRVEVDFKLMAGVFMNIVDNAVKYSTPGTLIKIEAEIVHDKINVRIRDEGFGIPKEDLERIFDKFYRAVQPKRVTGTGLGLSITRGIVEAHGGKILAENNRDKGATFTLLLPLETEASR